MRTRQRKKKRTGVKVFLIILALFVVGVGVYGFTIWNSLNKTVTKIHSPLDREKSDKREKAVDVKDAHPFSVLLLGVDAEDGGAGRTDSMIVLSVNPKKESVEMVSIPRDTRTEIIGKGIDDKINHAFAFGGIDMSLATVEHLLDIPVDYYVQIDMDGFKEIVDAVGGVTVNNDLDFTVEGTQFKLGKINLKGEEALKFARMRYEDPRGDFGRQMRQRQIIQAVIKEGASVSTLWNFGDIFDALGNNVTTNLTFEEMQAIQKKYKGATKSFDQVEIQGEGTKIDGIYYYIVSEEERQAVSQKLRTHLELK